MQIKLKPGVKEQFDEAFPEDENSIRVRIERLKEQIRQAEEKIEDIQAECQHIDHLYKPGADTGNWCKQDDSYWMNVRCLDCGKRIHFSDQMAYFPWAKGKRGTKVKEL